MLTASQCLMLRNQKCTLWVVTSINLPIHGREVEAVMAAARVLMGVSAQSVAAIDDPVTLPQLRVLVMVASRGPLNLGAVATGLGVHSSNATRLVERLVVAGLLDRRDDPADRRNLLLELTAAGRELVDNVMDHRRAAIVKILERMPSSRRRTLAAGLRSFAEAGDEVSDDAVWSLGWTTTPG
jgi:DNA-binding MarR family transcriptional regulator